MHPSLLQRYGVRRLGIVSPHDRGGSSPAVMSKQRRSSKRGSRPLPASFTPRNTVVNVDGQRPAPVTRHCANYAVAY